MNPAHLLSHFDRMCEASDAVPRLRQFILDLAVRGKLVEQDPGDEPASELLKRIRSEKARLVSEGEISAGRPKDEANIHDLAFQLPTGWQPVTISHLLLELQTGPFGSTLHQSDYCTGGIPVINPASIQDGRLVPIADMAVAPSTLKRLQSFALRADDIVMARRGEMGRCAVVSPNEHGWLCGTGSLILRLPSSVFPPFVAMLIGSPLVRGYLSRSAVGTTMQNLNQRILLDLVIGLPPTAEQRRIVAKVEELMALCDQLAAAKTEREARRDRLAAASMHRLSSGADADPAVFRENARFHLLHLHRLTTRSDQIKQLRETILSFAVRGRLLDQDPADAPASELLAQIQEERMRLEGAHSSRQEPQRSPRFAPPYAIPNTWCWASLGDIALGFRYGTSLKCSYEPVGQPVLRIPNVASGRINAEDMKYGALPQREIDELRLQLGDILMVRSNGSLGLVGRPALVERHVVGYCYAGYLVRVRTSTSHTDARYLVMALSSAHVRRQIEKPIRTTVGLKNVNATELAGLTLALPPLAEQRRIVEKVDELQALCDRIEEHVAKGDAERGRLLEAVLHQALAPTLGSDRGTPNPRAKRPRLRTNPTLTQSRE